MDKARRSVPRRADVPFHIAVIGEEFAVRIECQVIVITKSAGKDRDCTGCWINAQHGAAGCNNPHRVSTRIPHALADEVFTPWATCAVTDAFRNRCVISKSHIQRAVRTLDDAVCAMFAAVIFPMQHLRLLLVCAVAIGIRQPPQPGLRTGGGRIHPQVIAGEAQALRTFRRASEFGDAHICISETSADAGNLNSQRLA